MGLIFERHGLALNAAERFIDRLRDRYSADARLELRLAEEGVYAQVYVDDELDERLIGQYARGGMLNPQDTRRRVYLAPRAGSSYVDDPHIYGIHPELYVGVVDAASPAALSIRVGDLTPKMQEFPGLFGPVDE